MKVSRRNKILLWCAILIVIILFFTLPIEIPYSVNAPGKILPGKELIVVKGNDGAVIAETKDNIRGISTGYSVFQFIRGDAIQFSFSKNISNGSPVSINDTIAYIYSNELERELIDLKGEIEVAEASLTMLETGEKKSLIDEQVEQVEYMKRQSAEQKRVLGNLEELYKKNLVSQDEYDIAKSQSDLYDLKVSIAEAQLQSVKTGVKKEEVDYLRSKIIALQKESNILLKKFKDYTIVSQIDGIVVKPYSIDTLLIVADTTDYIVLIPVQWAEREKLSLNQPIQIEVPEYGKINDVTITGIDNSVHLINNNQVLFVSAKIPAMQAGIMQGLIVQGSIKCQPIHPYDYLKKLLISIFW